MFRKRRQPTPNFRMPPPFQPISGHHASLQAPGLWPYCALMQIAEDDIYDNYCLCRGFDTRMNKFVDYEAANSEKPGIPVAKPYGYRMLGLYEKAQIYAAFLPIQSSDSAGDTSSSVYRVPPSPTTAPIRLGQNPGKASVSQGHPASLSEEVEILYTEGQVEDQKVVNWMFLEGPTSARILFGQLAEAMCTTATQAAIDNITDCATGVAVANLTAKNTFTLSGLNDDYVLLIWIAAIDDWVIFQVQHHLVAVLVEGSVYISGNELRGKIRDIAAMYCAAERDVKLLDLEAC